MVTVASGINGTFDCDPEILLASYDHDLLFAPYIFCVEFSIGPGIAWMLDSDFEKGWKEKERTDRSLRKELLVIYSMVVLELAFATMGSPIVTFKYLFNGDRCVLG